MTDLDLQEGLQLRRLRYGGFLVCHPDIYELGSLYFAATTINEAFDFMRGILDRPRTATKREDEK